jgi:hypothetical protein
VGSVGISWKDFCKLASREKEIKKLKAYKFRLYPNKTQEILLNKTFGCVRYAWNQNVAQFNTYDKETNPKPEFKTSTELRKEIEWMKEVSAAAIQQKEMDFKEFKKQLFNTKRKTKLSPEECNLLLIQATTIGGVLMNHLQKK